MPRNQHSRPNDHTGSLAISNLALQSDINGRYPTLPSYPAGTPVADVLEDLLDRLSAVPIKAITASAIIRKTQQWTTPGEILYSFSAEARLGNDSSFTADAVIS